MNSRTGDILQSHAQQGENHGLAAHNHSQTTSGIWDLANSTDMSYELAAAGTGRYFYQNCSKFKMDLYQYQ